MQSLRARAGILIQSDIVRNDMLDRALALLMAGAFAMEGTAWLNPGNWSTTFGFADGHAEKHKWAHRETWKMFKGEMDKAVLVPPLAENRDMRWCWERYPYLSAGEQPF